LFSLDDKATKVHWAQDASWRFMPVVAHNALGYVLHPIDLATNKVLALAGRDEARDFLDLMLACEALLPLGALLWAAVGKDPGFSPRSLLEMIRRRGKYQPDDFEKLHLSEPIDLQSLKTKWIEALDQAEAFIDHRPSQEMGCLYFDVQLQAFVAPQSGPLPTTTVLHFGRPGGLLPAVQP